MITSKQLANGDVLYSSAGFEEGDTIAAVEHVDDSYTVTTGVLQTAANEHGFHVQETDVVTSDKNMQEAKRQARSTLSDA